MIEELLESYLNGNIGYVREQMRKEYITLSEMVALYVDRCNPSANKIVLMIMRLEK